LPDGYSGDEGASHVCRSTFSTIANQNGLLPGIHRNAGRIDQGIAEPIPSVGFRMTLVQLGDKICSTREKFKVALASVEAGREILEPHGLLSWRSPPRIELHGRTHPKKLIRAQIRNSKIGSTMVRFCRRRNQLCTKFGDLRSIFLKKMISKYPYIILYQYKEFDSLIKILL